MMRLSSHVLRRRQSILFVHRAYLYRCPWLAPVVRQGHFGNSEDGRIHILPGIEHPKDKVCVPQTRSAKEIGSPSQYTEHPRALRAVGSRFEPKQDSSESVLGPVDLFRFPVQNRQDASP